MPNHDGLPRSIKFHCGKRGKIRWLKRMPPAYRDCAGYSDPSTRQTVMLKTRTNRLKAADLLHELCHHAMYPLQPLKRSELGGGLDEAAIKTLSSHLAELWSLNPDLFLWLHGRLTGQEVVDAEEEDSG